MPETPQTAAEAAQILAPRCRNTTLEDLARLSCMTDNRSNLVVPHSFFHSNCDKLWLLERDLIKGVGYNIAITEKGRFAISLLKGQLASMFP